MQFPIAELALQTLMETSALIAITLNAFNVRPFLPSSDAITCITCLPGDFFNTTPSGCLPPMYGDSRWNYPSEACDDSDAINDDGCDALCQVETDYAYLKLTNFLQNHLSANTPITSP